MLLTLQPVPVNDPVPGYDPVPVDDSVPADDLMHANDHVPFHESVPVDDFVPGAGLVLDDQTGRPAADRKFPGNMKDSWMRGFLPCNKKALHVAEGTGIRVTL